ncbi:MAG: hypothetical protein IPK20_25795 [Betaproteobacteria bacterium]|nr:hypothetical protein [Betaproteobacteria bacterium]
MNRTPPPPADPESAGLLISAIGRLLRPLVRLAIRHGVTFPAFSDLLKNTYLDVAQSELAGAQEEVTDSRISLLTGVHRKYVKKLRHDARSALAQPAPRQISLAAQIAAVWNSRKEYLDQDGEPRPLARQSSAAEDASFETLVHSVSKDIHPRVILDEWLRAGVAELDAQGRVCLRRSAFVPVADIEQQSHYLGQNVHDHLAAIERNMSDPAAPFLERCVHYGNLRPESCAELSAVAEKVAMKALRAVNDRVLGGGAGARTDEVRWRMNFGVYFYAEPETDADDRRARPSIARNGKPEHDS